MICSKLAEKVEACYPDADPLDVVRICTLMLSSIGESANFESDEEFMEICETINLRLSAASDQHAAVTEELEDLASSDPREFDQDKIWVLIRAIKIQSQILRMYVGDPAMKLD